MALAQVAQAVGHARGSQKRGAPIQRHGGGRLGSGATSGGILGLGYDAGGC